MMKNRVPGQNPDRTDAGTMRKRETIAEKMTMQNEDVLCRHFFAIGASYITL